MVCTCHVVVASFSLLAGVFEGSERGEQMEASTDSGRIPGCLLGSGGGGDGGDGAG